MNKNYNMEDEQYKNVIESLKQLPRIDAPPDFEMNLRRRLNTLKAEEKRGFFYYFTLKMPLIPATALGVCLVVVLFLVNRTADPGNPFMTLPSLRTQASGETDKSVKQRKYLIDPNSISENDVVTRKSNPPAAAAPKPKQTESLTPQQRRVIDQMAQFDRRSSRPQPLDFGGYENDLDQSLRAKPDPNGGGQYGGNPGANVNFGGFNFMPDYDRNLDQLRARMDSLKKLRRANR